MQIIDAYVNKSNRCSVKENLWAWDYGITLQVHGVSFNSAPKVHFSREFETKTFTLQSIIENNILSVEVPDELLQSESPLNFRIIAQLYSEHIDPDWGRTKIEIEIPVKARLKPDNYIYTPDEIKTWEKLEKSKADKIEIEDQTIKLMSGDAVLSSAELPGAFIATVSEDEEGYLHSTATYDEITSALDKGQTVYAELDASVKLKFGEQDLSGFSLRLAYDSTYNGAVTFYGKLADKLYSYLTITADSVDVNVFFEDTEAANAVVVIDGGSTSTTDKWTTETTVEEVVNYIKAGITLFILRLQPRSAMLCSGLYQDGMTWITFTNSWFDELRNSYSYDAETNTLTTNKTLLELTYRLETQGDGNVIQAYYANSKNEIGLIEYTKNTYTLWNRDSHITSISADLLDALLKENAYTEFNATAGINGKLTPSTSIDESIMFPLTLRKKSFSNFDQIKFGTAQGFDASGRAIVVSISAGNAYEKNSIIIKAATYIDHATADYLWNSDGLYLNYNDLLNVLDSYSYSDPYNKPTTVLNSTIQGVYSPTVTQIDDDIAFPIKIYVSHKTTNASITDPYILKYEGFGYDYTGRPLMFCVSKGKNKSDNIIIIRKCAISTDLWTYASLDELYSQLDEVYYWLLIPECKFYTSGSEIYKIEPLRFYEGASLYSLFVNFSRIRFIHAGTGNVYVYEAESSGSITSATARHWNFNENSLGTDKIEFTIDPATETVTYKWKTGNSGDVYNIPIVDTELLETSTNAVQNKAVAEALSKKSDLLKATVTQDSSGTLSSDTTFEDIKSAIQSGNSVFVQTDNTVLDIPLSILPFERYNTNTDQIYFAGVYYDSDNSTLQKKLRVDSDGWAVIDSDITDSELSASSTRPVQNKAVKAALDGKQAAGDYATNTALTEGLATKQDAGDYNKQRVIGINNSILSQYSPWSYDGPLYKSILPRYLADVHYPYDGIQELTYGIESDCDAYYYTDLSIAISDYNAGTYDNGIKNPSSVDEYSVVIYEYTKLSAFNPFSELCLLSDISTDLSNYSITRKYAFINLNGHLLKCSTFVAIDGIETLIYDPVGTGSIYTTYQFLVASAFSAIIGGHYSISESKYYCYLGYCTFSHINVTESKYPYDKQSIICYNAHFDCPIAICGNGITHHNQYVEFDKCEIISKNANAIYNSNSTYSINVLLKNSTIKVESSDMGAESPSAIQVYANTLILDNCVCEATNCAVSCLSKNTLIINSLLSGAGHGGVYALGGTTYIQNSTLRKLDGSAVIPTSNNPYAAYFGYRSVVFCDSVTFDCLYNNSYGRPAIRKEGSYKTVHAYFSNCTMRSIRVDAGTYAHLGQGMDYLKDTTVSGTIVDEGEESYSWTYSVNYGTSEYQTIIDEVLTNTSARHTHDNKTVLDGITATDVTNWNNKAEQSDIPTIPESLKNPAALTIKIGSVEVTYDGSSAQSITIEDGTEVEY